MKAFLMTAAEDSINLLFNEFKFNTWEDISPAIGCHTFDVVRLDENGDCAYIDDEGLYQPRFFWIHKNYPTPIANNALFCGTDEMGETVDFKTPLEVLKESIKPVAKAELYVYSRTNPEDYRPFFFDDFDNPYASGGKNSSGDRVDCDCDCDYSTVKAGECQCYNNKHDEMESRCPV
jgi:hypothetical protein